MEADSLLAEQLTPVGMGAIAVVRITAAQELAAQTLFASLTGKGGIAARPVSSVIRAVFLDGSGNPIDDGLLIRTGRTSWELHVHGGTAVMAALLQRLRD